MKGRQATIFAMIPSNKGFTFIELVIVVVILGVLSATAIPGLRQGFENARLEGCTQDLYYLCRYLQESATAGRGLFRLQVSPERKKLWASFKEKDEFKAVEGRFGRIYPIPEGINLSCEALEIYFYPDGTTDSAIFDFENAYRKKLSIILYGANGEIKVSEGFLTP